MEIILRDHANYLKRCAGGRRLLAVMLMTVLGICQYPAGAGVRAALSVSGRVTTEAGEPLPGVNIIVKGTMLGTVSDADGRYSLDVAGDGTQSVLVFSFIGYVTQEVNLNGRTSVDVIMQPDVQSLSEVVVVGYGTKSRESITAAVSTVTSKDLERVHGGSTVSSGLAGKLAGVSFRMPDGRPGASALIQIRNLGNPLYVIDGIQQDAGQFNNISPTDIESITILKDASAAIYGVRAANGVVLVTTKRGKAGTPNSVNIDAYTGWQNWSRFPETVNAYQWQLGKTDAEMNRVNPSTNMTPEELEKWRQGTEYGYQNFDWYDFIIQPNSPLTSFNVNATGGAEKINYYISATRLDQNSVLGREFTFGRTNIQSNIDAQIAERLKVGVQINGRIETRDNPGVPGVDDYWAPRFALFRNRPYERPYANDNPKYLNDIGHNSENWGLLNKQLSGYWTQNWRVLQTNFNAEYKVPGIDGLTAAGKYSYYMADNKTDGHEYTYDAYTYHPETDTYERTGGSSNPWRERINEKVFNTVLQGQLHYDKTFDRHTIAATYVYERIERQRLYTFQHGSPSNNFLPNLSFAELDALNYQDLDEQEARIGYVGRISYGFADRYYLEVSARRDGSWKFPPDKRWGFFPSASIGWRITEEQFFKDLMGDGHLLSDLKFRASHGKTGDDGVPGLGPFDYISGYNYNSGGAGRSIFDGTVVLGSRDTGVPITNITWFTSVMTDVGADFALLSGKISGTVDYFYRKRTGLRGRKYDVVIPVELGYSLPDENVNSDAVLGWEGSLAYHGMAGDFQYTIGGNLSFARSKFLSSYKPRWGNSWDHYRNSQEDRWSNIMWGLEAIGQFQSTAQISDYPVNIDGQGNKTLLPGDIIYKDQNGDGKIDGYDERPIGYAPDRNPIVNFGLNLSVQYKRFDFTADFSGGAMYTFMRRWEMLWPYQNGGNLLKEFYDDRWHRSDVFDVNSEWIPGKYPALRFNEGGHSNYRDGQNNTFWSTNVKYLRARTIELGYSVSPDLLTKIRMQRARVYVNTYNLFSLDNLKDIGIDPEIIEPNGLQYPPNRFVNVGVNLTF